MSGDLVALYKTRLAREKGTVRKDWGGKLTVALAYPNHYRLGMSNLGVQTVYRLFNARRDVVAERVFLPEGREMSLYLQSKKALMSLESQVPLANFDLISFSLSFENDYPNVLRMLELGKIPLLADERTDASPLVSAGGVTTFLNPEVLAPFVDLFLLGEAEANLDPFVELFSELRQGSLGRKNLLRALAAGVESLYVPGLYEPAYHKDGTLKSFLPREDHIPEKIKAACSRGNGTGYGPAAVSAVTTPDTEFGERVLIELGRGCGRSCRFCAAGYVYRPPRPLGESDALRSTENALASCHQVGLLSAAVSDIPGVENLMAMILERGCTFSISSVRADGISEDMLKLLKESGQKTIAIAPEAGSERLRAVINKHLTRDQIVEAVRRMAKVRDFSLRLYFLIGLPTETRRDVSEIVNLVKTIKHHIVKTSAPRGKIGRIRLSVNCFVPKPFTPFQWLPMEHVSILKEKQRWLKKTLEKEGGIKVNTDVPKWAYIQTLLSVGDRRVGSMLLKAHELRGNWTDVMRSSGVNPDFFVYRPKGPDEVLPWDFIEHGISKRYLRSEYEMALKGQESDVCHVGECYRCGVCSKPRK